MPSRSPLLSVVKASAVTFVMGFSLVVLPMVPALIAPFLALPAAFVVARWGLRACGVLSAVISALLIWVMVGIPTAVLVLFSSRSIGMLLGWALSAGWRFEPTLVATSGGALGAVVGWGLVLWLVFGVDFAWFKEAAGSVIDNTAAQYVQLGMSTGSAETVAAQLRRFVEVVPYVTPGLLGMVAILLASSSIGLAYLIFPRLRDRLPVTMSLSGFRMHWAAAYGSIAGLAMLLFARGGSTWSTVVMYIGINMLLVSQTLFFVQGVAVARWFALRRGMSKGGWGVLFVAAVVAQGLLQLTGLVGLFDTWIDYRRRFAVKNPEAGSTDKIHK